MNKRIIVLLFSLTFIFSGCQSPQKAIEKLENIIEEQDAEGLYKLVHLEEDVYWSEKEAKDIIKYFSENKTAYEEQLGLLNDQKDALKDKQELVNKTGLFYFNDQKELFVRTYEVLLVKDSFAEFQELVVSLIEEEEVSKIDGSNEDISVGLFGPGNYHIQGKADYGYVALEDNDEVSLFDDKEFSNEVELALKGDASTIFSDQPETIFYINGNEVHGDIGVDGGVIIQPLVNGLTIQAKNKYSWGELVSEEVEYIGELTNQINYESVSFQPSYEINLTPYIFANEEEKDEIAHIITDFNEKLLKGLANNDPSYLDDVVATKEAVAGFDSDFETLTAVEKGELKASSFPPGTAMIFIGHYEGGLNESIIDFYHAENVKDEEKGEDLLTLKVVLNTNFFYIPEGVDEAKIDKDSIRYIEPLIQLKKENNKWIITEQLIELKSIKSEPQLSEEGLVKTKVKK